MLKRSEGQIDAAPQITKTSAAESVLEGKQLYQPTRLEWLALKLNALYSVTRGPVVVAFFEVPDKNAIKVFVKYEPEIDKAKVKEQVEFAKQKVLELAKDQKWDDWVKVEQQLEIAVKTLWD